MVLNLKNPKGYMVLYGKFIHKINYKGNIICIQ